LDLPYLAALQSKRRDLIKRPQGVLQIKPSRAAGRESKNFCFPFGLKFVLSWSASQVVKTFVSAKRVRRRNFIKSIQMSEQKRGEKGFFS
jgi:hypothetical protein